MNGMFRRWQLQEQPQKSKKIQLFLYKNTMNKYTYIPTLYKYKVYIYIYRPYNYF